MAIFGTDNPDTIPGTTDDDDIFTWAFGGSAATDTGPNLVTADLGDDSVTSGVASDALFGNQGNDTLLGGEGFDVIFGGQGEDRIDTGSGATDDIADGGAGDDTIGGGGGEDTLSGGAGADYVVAGDGANVVAGGDGSDTVSATVDGTGDTLKGGAGFDVWLIDGGADAIGFAASLDPSGTTSLPVTQSGFEKLHAIGGSGGDTIFGGGFDDDLDGGEGDDELGGGGGGDYLEGEDGFDTIFGGVGDDIVDGGSKAGELDRLDGGGGQDAWSVVWSTAEDLTLVLKGPGQTTELLANGLIVTLADGFERIDVRGGAGADSIVGGAGDDRIAGGVNANTLAGGGGDDTIVSHQAISAALPEQIDGGKGVDAWESDWSASSEAIVVTLDEDGNRSFLTANGVLATVATGFERIFISTGSGADSLTGASGDDALGGGAGADTLFGNNGDDFLRGQEDADLLNGGKGDDILSSGSGFDQLFGGLGDDRLRSADDANGVTSLDGGGGEDAWEVFWTGAQSIVLKLDDDPNKTSELVANGVVVGSGVRMEALLAFGGVGNDRFRGAAGDDFLAGEAGSDTLSGGAGADTLVSGGAVGALDELDGGGGRDVWSFDGRDAVLNLTLDLEDKTGGVASLLDGVTVVATGAGMEALDAIGGQGADSLAGGGGNDTLDGFRGADTLDGGRGIDTASYRSKGEGVVVSLASKSGSGGPAAGDVLIGIENLVGSFSSDALTGDRRANALFGDYGDDTLAGGDGDDLLEGLGGGDLLIGGKGSDTAEYFNDSAEGQSEGEYNPFYEIEVSLKTGVARGGDAEGDVLEGVENLIGAAFNDILQGNDKANVLEGDEGADVLKGEGGRDAAAYSRAESGVSVSLASGRGKLGDAAGDVLSGIENLSGSSFNDVLKGDERANELFGRLGSDTLSGGAGEDTLSGGGGRDVFRFAEGFRAGPDHIVGFKLGEDVIELEGEVFRAFGAGRPKSFAYDGHVAQDKLGRLVYDDRTGALSYDADGDEGRGKAVTFAVLDDSPRITAEDFFVTPFIV